jgi:hypothetical protein
MRLLTMYTRPGCFFLLLTVAVLEGGRGRATGRRTGRVTAIFSIQRVSLAFGSEGGGGRVVGFLGGCIGCHGCKVWTERGCTARVDTRRVGGSGGHGDNGTIHRH